jgi:tRNA (cmo5U34)-methyltransferase
MTLDSEAFEINRWHSPQYVASWMTDRTREAVRKPLRVKLVSFLPFEPAVPVRVLDLGAGTGGLSLEILGSYPNVHLVCQDFSEAMLAHARQRLLPFSTQVTFVKSDLRDPEWTRVIEGKFDAVVSSLVMHTVPDRVKEIYRDIFDLIKAGGYFLSGDTIAAPGPMLAKIYLKSRLLAYQTAMKAETGVEKSLAEIEQELRERRRNRSPNSPNRERNPLRGTLTLVNHLEWLRQAGFDEVDCLWKDIRHAIVGGVKHSGSGQ